MNAIEKRGVFVMKKYKQWIFLRSVLIVMLWINGVQAEKLKSGNLLVLPMPNGLTMDFVPVCVNSGKSLFDWKKIKLGDP